MATSKRFSARHGLDNNSNTIQNVADPVNAQDAATKAFSSNASNLASGTVDAARLPAFTGDATSTAGTSALTLSNSGVTAGTYKSVTVDAKGRVTAGTNPTTLSGYGITDAVSSSLIGAASGIVPLGADSKIATTYLPSYVDDVLEYANQAGFPASGETGKIYVALDTNKIYRWSGSVYIEISPTAGNADTATKLATARTISLTGDVTGSVSFDGSADASITATIAANSVVLGTDTTGNYVADLTAGSYITKSGTAGEGWSPTIAVDATSANTASKVVARDASGNFSAGTITATLTGNASTATALATGRTIAMTGDVTWTSTSFDGSANVTGTATLANSGVTAGTYKSVTVDDKGRVTAGTNPTTLSGYGITDAASLTGTETLTNKTVSGGVYSNVVDVTGSIRSSVIAVAALNIDCSLGNFFTKTINANSTFTFSNAPASKAYSFVLELTHTSGTVTWPAAVRWPADTAPTLTAGKTHIFVFVSDDGGTTWRGASSVDYTN